MEKIVYIADPEVIAIPIEECNEPLIDLAYQSDISYGPPPECELTSGCYTKIRWSVYEKLVNAQKALPHGWKFRVYEGFRSLGVQKQLFNQEYSKLTEMKPQLNPQQLFRETTRIVSPVTNLDKTPNMPAHNSGGAIDIEIIDKDGVLIDMGMAINQWAEVDPDLCMTECPSLTTQANSNRKILLDTLQKHGFVNYPTEWWHFSYGDRYWAFITKNSNAVYGSADHIPVRTENASGGWSQEP